ncbi:MAG: short-chain dehydrogenase [Tagaea sp. CACIAM 22H2]|jgi:NAD(P)-dependent dehydrogenase (short-subunit alcohol dehydrogenase family)|nr:short-chain dehydrogenase [Tagaea sp. CACIAM 22H2]
MSRLNGKTALVTGGTTGIGLETARRFLAEGARVAITGNNPDNLAAATKDLGGNVLAIRADSASVAAQKDLAAQIAAKFGKLDILFANAGIATLGAFDTFSEAEYDKQIDVNVKGPFFLTQALLPHFAPKASIIYTASVVASVGFGNSEAYSASKGAILAMSRALAVDLVGRGIRVNTISPGPIATPIFGKVQMTAEQREGMAAQIASAVPMKRFGEPVEIANAAVFLASDESSYVTGSDIIVDGGMVAA